MNRDSHFEPETEIGKSEAKTRAAANRKFTGTRQRRNRAASRRNTPKKPLRRRTKK